MDADAERKRNRTRAAAHRAKAQPVFAVRELRISRMASASNQQIVLKPQDFLVALKVALARDRALSYAAIATELSISVSEAHASAKRAQLARLLAHSVSDGLVANREALCEFAVHGVKYSFPPIVGPVVRGVPTAFAGPTLRNEIVQSGEDSPVWPYPSGSVRGPTLYPLYPSVPQAAARDEALYDVLTLIDALRIGAARERELAAETINRRLS